MLQAPEGRAGVQVLLAARNGCGAVDHGQGGGQGGLELSQVPRAAFARLPVAGLPPAGAARRGGAFGGDGHLSHGGVQLGKDDLGFQQVRPGERPRQEPNGSVFNKC